MSGTKLDDKKIKKIIRWKEKDYRTKDIAKKLGISERRVQQIWKEYRETGEVPKLKRRGRKPTDISKEEVDIVLKALNEYKGTSPVHLEKHIERRYNIHIPHNRIYTILKQLDIIKPRKKKKPKRFNASKPNELWQMDFKVVDIEGVRYYSLLIIDDYSRYILHAKLYNEATTKVVLSALEDCFKTYGKSEKILTDNGTQFVSARGDLSKFQMFLMDKGIQHIRTSVRHPQTIGKVERINREVEYRLTKFDNVDEFRYWHNCIKPHRSLNFRTPYEFYFENINYDNEVIL